MVVVHTEMTFGMGAGADTGVGRARETASVASRHIVRDVTHAGIAGRLGGEGDQILLGRKHHPAFRKCFFAGTNSTFTQQIFLELKKMNHRLETP